jgi:hypothetical protein
MKYAFVLKEEPFYEKEHCCSDMSSQANMHSLSSTSALLGTTDKRIYWSPVFDEYGLICQPSAEILIITHCPFCGSLLPPSRRDAWFSRLEETGWQSWEDPIPKELLSHEWQ